jgi:hypothetical protein
VSKADPLEFVDIDSFQLRIRPYAAKFVADQRVNANRFVCHVPEENGNWVSI